MNTLFATLLTLAVSALLPLPLFADDDKREHQGHEKDPMAAHVSKLSGEKFEAAFLSLMIQHHRDGVKMAELAVEKAQSSELKQMMQKSIREQRQDIDKMIGWLQQWHNETPAAHKMPEESIKMMEKDMAALRSADGKEFDRLFASKMARHHMGGIEMSKLAEEKAEHKEVKDLAKKIISTQSEEREKLLEKDGK